MAPPRSAIVFARGKPTWLLVNSTGSSAGKTTDAAFAQLQETMRDKASFRRLEWASKAGASAIEQFSLTSPPASVIADSRGIVVRKLEGPRTAEQMAGLLKPLTGHK